MIPTNPASSSVIGRITTAESTIEPDSTFKTKLDEWVRAGSPYELRGEAASRIIQCQKHQYSSLNLYGLWLKNLPDECLEQLTHLQELELNKNELTSLPESIGNLTNLRSLDVGTNKITRLPDSLKNLKSLSSVNVRFNQIKESLDTLKEKLPGSCKLLTTGNPCGPEFRMNSELRLQKAYRHYFDPATKKEPARIKENVRFFSKYLSEPITEVNEKAVSDFCDGIEGLRHVDKDDVGGSRPRQPAVVFAQESTTIAVDARPPSNLLAEPIAEVNEKAVSDFCDRIEGLRHVDTDDFGGSRPRQPAVVLAQESTTIAVDARPPSNLLAESIVNDNENPLNGSGDKIETSVPEVEIAIGSGPAQPIEGAPPKPSSEPPSPVSSSGSIPRGGVNHQPKVAAQDSASLPLNYRGPRAVQHNRKPSQKVVEFNGEGDSASIPSIQSSNDPADQKPIPKVTKLTAIMQSLGRIKNYLPGAKRWQKKATPHQTVPQRRRY